MASLLVSAVAAAVFVMNVLASSVGLISLHHTPVQSDTALTPEDINESKQHEQGGVEKPLGGDDKPQPRGRLPRNLDDSCSRQVLRDLSPLGTRTYAAPEVLSGIRNVIQLHLDSSSRVRQKRRNSKSECTSDYGMVADAYSVGSTIR